MHLHKACCTNLLTRADKGLDTVIGEGGLKLWAEKNNALSIARALLRNPHLLIFDEATSALDSITEEEITSYHKTDLRHARTDHYFNCTSLKYHHACR